MKVLLIVYFLNTGGIGNYPEVRMQEFKNINSCAKAKDFLLSTNSANGYERIKAICVEDL